MKQIIQMVLEILPKLGEFRLQPEVAIILVLLILYLILRIIS
jgi:hypothetical protein